MHRRARKNATAALVAMAVVAAGCGGSDEGEAEVPPTTSPQVPVSTSAPAPTTEAIMPDATIATTSTSTTAAPVATTGPPATTAPPATTTSTIPEGVVITIGDLFFRPSALTVAAGETVVWQNDGEFPHTTTAGTPAERTLQWHSGTMRTGDTFATTFDTAGTFQYFCSIHPNDMQATIIVTGG